MTAPPSPASDTATSFPPAGLDRRFYAFALDHLVAWGIDLAAGLLAGHYLMGRGHLLAGILVIAGTVVLLGVVFAVVLGTTGSTPGKALFGLRAVRADTGGPIGVGRALLRALILFGATLPAGFGLAALAWTAVADPSRHRRGWHDQVAGSVVLDVRPVLVVEEADDAGPRQVVNLTAMRLVPARHQPAPEPVRLPARAPSRSRPPAAPDDSRPPSERTTVRDPALVQAAAASQAEPPVPSAPLWGLVLDTGDRVPVDTLVLVGRRPEPRAGEEGARLVAVPSADMSVSKTHAQVVTAPDGTLVVTDRGSTNGSVLLRQGVARPLSAGRPTTLLDGDVVRFGDRQLSVVRFERGRSDPA